MAPPKVLLTGSTGYIGRSILSHIVNSSHPTLENLTSTSLVRGEDRVPKMQDVYGKDRFQPTLYQDLDDIECTIGVASQHDILINTALAYHAESAAALVRGLAERKQALGKGV